VKKVFPFEPNKTILIELASYGVAATLATFVTTNFLENLGLFNMFVSVFISLGILGWVAITLMPSFKPEMHVEVVADSLEGYIQKGKTIVTKQDVKKIFVINYKEGKQVWQIFRINGKRSIGIDTRSYPEADKLNTMLTKIYPNIKIEKLNARSPFTIIILTAFIYIAAILLVGVLI
jgi:hypothetical protein